MRFEALIRQAGEPEECAVLTPLDRPQAVTALLETGFDPIHQRVALGAFQRP